MLNVLEQRPDLLRNKKVIVFAFNAPYFLDATDISKLTAYYGLYSKGPNFLDAAARVLFQEITPAGALPVSVPGIGYEVLDATKPDPTQIIPLYEVIPGKPPPTTQVTTTPYPTAAPSKIGDTIDLQTGVILDSNHHPVPDGTGVEFAFTIGGDSGSTQQIEATTVLGIASLSYQVNKSGQIQIGVSSNQATQSMTITLNVPGGVTPGATVIMITPVPSITPTHTLVPNFYGDAYHDSHTVAFWKTGCRRMDANDVGNCRRNGPGFFNQLLAVELIALGSPLGAVHGGGWSGGVYLHVLRLSRRFHLGAARRYRGHPGINSNGNCIRLDYSFGLVVGGQAKFQKAPNALG